MMTQEQIIQEALATYEELRAFDTLDKDKLAYLRGKLRAYVQILEFQGFTEEQAKGIMLWI